jgi:hypothetical protein
MNTRLIAASVLAIGLLASSAMAGKNESGYCGKGSTYDRDTLTCVDQFGGTVTDNAALSSGYVANKVDARSVGDFIDESVTQRNERSSN